jgi:hypothetical protein
MARIAKQAFVGLDPGKSGAACTLFDTRRIKPLCLTFATATAHDIADYFEEVSSHLGKRAEPPYYLIEKVAGSTGGIQGRTSGRSMFTFGFNAGILYGMLVYDQLAEVTPSKWQQEFGLIRKNKKEKDGDKKRRHQVKAQRIFSSQKVTQAAADAYLIAAYCRRHYKELF